MLSTVVQILNIFDFGEELAKETKFQLFFLSILALEILFILIKPKPEIEGLTIFDYHYRYSAYANDTTFFLKSIISVKHMLTLFIIFFRTFWN